jgi:hypothetical protein
VARRVSYLELEVVPLEALALSQVSLYLQGFGQQAREWVGSRLAENIGKHLMRPDLYAELSLQQESTGNMVVVIVTGNQYVGLDQATAVEQVPK